MATSAERPTLARNMLLATGLLAGFAVLGVGLVALTELRTREQIDANERAYTLRALNEIVPEEARDNEMFTDTTRVQDPELVGPVEPVLVYRARRGGQPVAAILEVVAPDGYSGPIRLLVGVKADGSLAGVRAVSHRETPGLGDGIEAARSDWIHGFAGRRLGDPPEEAWTVKQDGGAFDQFTGATITPRAVVKAVKRALIYFEAHRTTIFETASEMATSAVSNDP